MVCSLQNQKKQLNRNFEIMKMYSVLQRGKKEIQTRYACLLVSAYWGKKNILIEQLDVYKY